MPLVLPTATSYTLDQPDGLPIGGLSQYSTWPFEARVTPHSNTLVCGGLVGIGHKYETSIWRRDYRLGVSVALS